MTSHLAEAGRTLIPRKDDRYGLLSPVSGYSHVCRRTGGCVKLLRHSVHVFVANVTGNIVFLVLHSPTRRAFVWWTSALTLATFMIGAFIGGRIIHYFGANRARHLLVSTSIQLAFVAAALVGIYLLNQFAPEPSMGGTDASAIARTALAQSELPNCSAY